MQKLDAASALHSELLLFCWVRRKALLRSKQGNRDLRPRRSLFSFFFPARSGHQLIIWEMGEIAAVGFGLCRCVAARVGASRFVSLLLIFGKDPRRILLIS
jgi:hypothetical protein